MHGKDLVKYTFNEQCEEVANLKLEDGTTKIFLNMTSKNGAPELVRMLQERHIFGKPRDYSKRLPSSGTR